MLRHENVHSPQVNVHEQAYPDIRVQCCHASQSIQTKIIQLIRKKWSPWKHNNKYFSNSSYYLFLHKTNSSNYIQIFLLKFYKMTLTIPLKLLNLFYPLNSSNKCRVVLLTVLTSYS